MGLTTDPRCNRRLQAAGEIGMQRYVFSFTREYIPNPEFDDTIPVVFLGRIEHGQYIRRTLPIARALVLLFRYRSLFAEAPIVYTFGLDCCFLAALCSELFRWRYHRFVYEVADVREVMLSNGFFGRMLRLIERWCLQKVDSVVVTSPAFRDEYFVKIQQVAPSKVSILENKPYPPMPPPVENRPTENPSYLTIGLFGLLRHQESWDTLMWLARRNQDRLRVYVRGYPFGLRGFEDQVNTYSNVIYEGPYVSPRDLADIYSRIDISWIVYQTDGIRQRKWMLPNRFFESLYYGCPMVVNKGGELARRVEEFQVGWVIDLSDREAVESLILSLTPDVIRSARQRCHQVARDQILGGEDNRRFFRKLRDYKQQVAAQ